MFSKHLIQYYLTAFLVVLILIPFFGCSGLKWPGDSIKHGPHKDAVENSDEIRKKIAEYEKRFYGQVDLAYKIFGRETSIPVAELAGGDELHVEFALSSKDFWQRLGAGFTEIGRDTRSDFTDRFITLPHQGGVRIGFVDLVRAQAIWSAIRGDTKTDLVMALDIPLVPDRMVHENPEQYPVKKRVEDDVFTEPPFTIIPKGHVVDMQAGRFADDSLRFTTFEIRFPELRQDGRRNVKTKRSGSFKQIKTTSWRETPKVRRDSLSLSQLVLPKGVAMVALIPTDCIEVSESSDWIGTTYIPSRNKISTSMILLVLPKRAAEAFEEKTP